eukprot:Gb_33635 [translate_table: standard]
MVLSSPPSSPSTIIPLVAALVLLSGHEGDLVPKTDLEAPIIRNEVSDSDLEDVTTFAIWLTLKTTPQAAKAPGSASTLADHNKFGKELSQSLPSLSITIVKDPSSGHSLEVSPLAGTIFSSTSTSVISKRKQITATGWCH